MSDVHWIEFYSKPHCPACKQSWLFIQNFLKNHLNDGTVRVVEKSAEKHRNTLIQAGATSAPVVVFPSGKMIQGFRPEQLESELTTLLESIVNK